MGRGFGGLGAGRGRGWRRLFYATGLTLWERLATRGADAPEIADTGEDLDSMKRRAQLLERMLADAKACIEAVEGKGSKASAQAAGDHR